MVEVRVLFEGGAAPSSNPNAATVGNSQRLRIALSRLLNRGLTRSNLRIILEPIYSNRNIVTIVANWKEGDCLLVDLDGPPKLRKERILNSGLSGIAGSVFFMVQAMEAWILSQPAAIDRVLAKYLKTDASAASDKSLIEKHPESISHPDRMLTAVIARHFEDPVTGKKVVYGKLRHSPDLLEGLEIVLLRETFSDVARLLSEIESRPGVS